LPEQRTGKVAATPAAPPKSQLDQAIDALVIGRNPDPFRPAWSASGRHACRPPLGHRAFHPGAISAAIRFLDSPTVIEATKLRPDGFFEATLPETQQDRPRQPPIAFNIALPPAPPSSSTTPTPSLSFLANSICT